MDAEQEIELVDKMARLSFGVIMPGLLAEYGTGKALGHMEGTTLEHVLKVGWGTAYMSAQYGMSVREAIMTTPAPEEDK